MFSYYCTFYNITIINYWCIYLNGNSGTVSKSNIFNNSPTNYGIVTVSSGNYILNECIFDQNKDNLIFIESGTLLYDDCYININTNYYLHSIYFTY